MVSQSKTPNLTTHLSKVSFYHPKDALETQQPAKHVVAIQAKKMTHRLSAPTGPLDGRQQDRHFPAIDKLDYNNYIVALNEILND